MISTRLPISADACTRGCRAREEHTVCTDFPPTEAATRPYEFVRLVHGCLLRSHEEPGPLLVQTRASTCMFPVPRVCYPPRELDRGGDASRSRGQGSLGLSHPKLQPRWDAEHIRCHQGYPRTPAPSPVSGSASYTFSCYTPCQPHLALPRPPLSFSPHLPRRIPSSHLLLAASAKSSLPHPLANEAHWSLTTLSS
jgi:hypothetical protein